MIADELNIHQLRDVPSGVAFLVSSEGELKNFESHLPESLKQAHPRAQKNWYLSRKLLLHAFESLEQKIDWQDLVFEGFQKIKAKPRFRFSLSHTEGAALVWLVEESQNLQIGVDVENSKREIGSPLLRKINNGEDMDLPALQLWGIKEASYKAIPQNQQQGITLNRLVIKKNQFFVGGTEQMGEWLQIVCENRICSLAWMQK